MLTLANSQQYAARHIYPGKTQRGAQGSPQDPHLYSLLLTFQHRKICVFHVTPERGVCLRKTETHLCFSD